MVGSSAACIGLIFVLLMQTSKQSRSAGDTLRSRVSNAEGRERTTVNYVYGCSGFAKDALPDAEPDAKVVPINAHDVQHLEFSEEPLELTTYPGPYPIPEELLKFTPQDGEIFKFFFKGTPKEVRIRQIFFHTPLTDQEQHWLQLIRDYCRWKNFPIRPCLEPLLLRICYYAWRKYGDKDCFRRAYEHIMETVNWRATMFPLNDTDPEILEDLHRGIMYWVARDQCFRPLLIVRLRRLPRSNCPLRFKRLTIFCFEWAIRYLFVPGLVETCIVVFDVRGIALHHFPMSALTDMTNTLTRQYPFRLDRMYIINDSIFIQTVWSVARQFLTEVQQKKMNFMRTGYTTELLKSFAAHQLEREYGGTRDELESFYPFPLVQGPFTPNTSSTPNTTAVQDCWKAVSRETAKGVVWEGDIRTPIQWSSEAPAVFAECGLPSPFAPSPDGSTTSAELGLEAEPIQHPTQTHPVEEPNFQPAEAEAPSPPPSEVYDSKPDVSSAQPPDVVLAQPLEKSTSLRKDARAAVQLEEETQGKVPLVKQEESFMDQNLIPEESTHEKPIVVSPERLVTRMNGVAECTDSAKKLDTVSTKKSVSSEEVTPSGLPVHHPLRRKWFLCRCCRKSDDEHL